MLRVKTYRPRIDAAPRRSEAPWERLFLDRPLATAEKSARARERMEDRDHCRSDNYRHHRGQHEDDQREQNLNRGLLRVFLSMQPATLAQSVGAGAQRGSDLCAKLFALNQGRGERLDIINCSPVGQSAQRLSKACTCGNIGGDEVQLEADFLPITFAFCAD